jgi:hypothetical protein
MDLVRGAAELALAHAVLRGALMGAVIAIVLPGAQTQSAYVRADLFTRYGIPCSFGSPRRPTHRTRCTGPRGPEPGRA